MGDGAWYRGDLPGQPPGDGGRGRAPGGIAARSRTLSHRTVRQMRLRRPAVQAHIVISDTSHGLPYSKGLMASSVMMAGVPPAHAYRVAEKVEQELNDRGVRQITSAELRYLAASLLAEIDQRHASTSLQWQAVEELHQRLVILLGGATGVAESTIARQLAARSGITRLLSTG